ncbi:MAG TPA: phytanoyl-CoA dioxygenase family protein [Steroidobacteraceae bacterium]|nr:phytanoyl-CoA dioxygenase family protein [Steroidobacteraceae bacterium]
MRISGELVSAYREEGVVVLRGIFRDWVDRLAEGVAEVMKHPSPYERTVRPQDGSAPFFQDYCNWSRIAAFRSFVFESPAAQAAAQLMSSTEARFFHEHVLVKEPGGSTVTPWHHDEPYYCVRAEQSVSFWTPLDPVARSVTLECVAGSQRWSSSGFRPTRFDGTPLYGNEDFPAVPDIDAQRDRLTIRAWELEPGDAVAFHFRTIHGAPANSSTIRRRVFSSRWVGEDARFVRRKGRTSPPFPELALEDGALLDAPEFPLVYRR